MAFAGQLRDSESGLCYNRFRYYDPTGGCYVSPDPLSILGGEQNYAYVHNPVGWVDPFGLAGCASVDKDGILSIKNKFSPGSAEIWHYRSMLQIGTLKFRLMVAQ
ncbi:RHS repeat-associated core domain-containing protein [Dickeya zeae]|nr:RHS repeat-associated core domain-containing protein [Dickeya zeae]